MTVIIIRHGEKVIEKGLSDAPLNENGRKQALKLGQYLASTQNIPQIYASTMRRAKETADIIASQTGSLVLCDDRLSEKNYRRSDQTYPDGTPVFVKNLPNGDKETKEQHLARIISFIRDHTSLLQRKIYIVSHGGVIARILEKIIFDMQTPMDHQPKPYCSVFVFNYRWWFDSFELMDLYTLDSKDAKAT